MRGRQWADVLDDGFESRRLFRVLGAVLLCELLLRLVYLSLGAPPLYKDPVDYWKMAEALANGDWLVRSHPIAFRTPGYPAFLAVFLKSLGSNALFGLAIAQHVLGVLTHLSIVALVYALTRSATGAFGAYLILATSFSTLYLSNLVMTETLYRFLVAALACAVYFYARRGTIAWAVCLGLILGTMTLVRPVAQLLFVPIAAMGILMPFERPRRLLMRSRLAHAAAITVMAAVVVMPWVYRNQVVFSEPFLTKFVGRSIWRAAFLSYARNLPYPESEQAETLKRLTGFDVEDAELRHNWGVYKHLRRSGLTELEAESLMLDVALQAIRENLLPYVASTPKGMAVFLAASSHPVAPVADHARGDPMGQARSGSSSARRLYEKYWPPPPTQSRILNMICSLLAATGLLGALTFRRCRLFAATLLAVVAYHAVISVCVEYPTYRYRAVLEPLFAVGVGLLALSHTALTNWEAKFRG